MTFAGIRYLPKADWPKGSRNKLSEDFIADLHESWLALGKAALVTAVRRYRFEVLRELVPKAGRRGLS